VSPLRTPIATSASSITALLVLASCSAPLPVLETFRGETPREHYLHALEVAGLSGTALATDWAQAGDSALAEAVQVLPPYAEEGFIEPGTPVALAYRIPLRRGQRLKVEARMEEGAPTRFFLELYRREPDREPRRLLFPEPGPEPLEYESRREEEILVRVQPELLRGGRYRVSVTVAGSLAFPVEGRDMGAILSFFGDDREAGRRVHHGVDVFAPRGTPVLAVSHGVVTRVGTQRLGGNVVWVRDEERGINQYYAHLDSQSVDEGTRVSPGDTLGTVGNTGNARTTPPHLHFGLYQRGEGPVDPWFFLFQPPSTPPVLALPPERLRGWARVREDGIRIRALPSVGAEVVEEVAAGTPLRVLAGGGEWLRVRLPDRRDGYILARLTEDAGRPLRTAEAAVVDTVRSLPLPWAPAVDRLSPGDDVEILGHYAGFLLVKGPAGRSGWVPEDGVGQ
jgi:peptidoglycan LD-endopeptidase LytH